MSESTKYEVGTVLESMVSAVGRFGRVSMDDLIKLVPANDKLLFLALEEGIRQGRVVHERGYVSGKEPGAAAPVLQGCPTCRGRLVVPTHASDQLMTKYMEACSQAPALTYLLNQRPVTRETSWFRALYMAWRGNLSGKRIVVMGDDDLTSLAIALLADDSEVIVLEADPRLVRFIQSIAANLGLANVAAREYDCRMAPPDDLIGTCDVAVTDPSSSLFEIFLSRCVSLVRPGSERSTIYTFAHPTYLHATMEFQELATRLGLIILDVVPGFNRYALVEKELAEGQNACYGEFNAHDERISFVEALVRLITTDQTAPTIVGAWEAGAAELYGERAARRLQQLDRDPARLDDKPQEWRELVDRFGGGSKGSELR